MGKAARVYPKWLSFSQRLSHEPESLMNHRSPRHFLLTLILGGVVCVPCGCNSKAAQSAHATTAVAGRRVEARSDGPVSVQNFGDRAVVSLPAHELTVERDRVLLDGADLAKLPAGATQIGVTAAEGELTVTADGVPIARKQLGK